MERNRRLKVTVWDTRVNTECIPADTASDLIPIEVKATNGRAKSLRTLIDGEKYADIHYGIKFTGGNIGYDHDVYTFSYFCVCLLKRDLKQKAREQ